MTFLLRPHSTNGFRLWPHRFCTTAALRKTMYTGASMQHYGTSSVEQVMICTVLLA